MKKNKEYIKSHKFLKAVVTDLDGTLLNKNHTVAPKDIEALQEIGEQGICRIIATGRSLYSYSQVLPSDFPADYLISSAGGGITELKTGKLIRVAKIDSVKVREIARKLDAYKIDFQVREAIPRGHCYAYKRYFDHNPDFDRLNANYREFSYPIESIDKLGDASRIISIAPNLDYIEYFNSFSEYSIIRATSPIDGQSVWMEIYPSGVNKGNALKWLLDRLQLPLKDTIGLGNDYNDIHFLDITKESFVVNEAPESLKKVYRTTVSHNKAPLHQCLKTCGII